MYVYLYISKIHGNFRHCIKDIYSIELTETCMTFGTFQRSIKRPIPTLIRTTVFVSLSKT